MSTFGAAQYSPEVRSTALEMIQALRGRVVLPEDALKGVRFKDDNRVLKELESAAATEEIFIEDPAFYIGRALVEAARADYWYAYEKKYDCDYGRHDYELDDEDNYVEE